MRAPRSLWFFAPSHFSWHTRRAQKTALAGTALRSLQPSVDLTKPEEDIERDVILDLISFRKIEEPNVFNFFAWWVQHSIMAGVPANTIILLLLLPLLSTIIAFIRVIVGLPSLELLVPIALSYALVATGVVLGGIVLTSIVVASFMARMLLKRVPIMYFPKRSLSLLLLSLLVFSTLTVSIQFGLSDIAAVSIFPILILTLLGDALISLQLHKSMEEALKITIVTIAIGVLGFFLATSSGVRDYLILYPEVILALIPINIIMGRYFGLRLSELLRFKVLR